ncbi:MAG: bifunctional oligoribonuclease/PAP phosphatase NrnA [Oscillospiraceae bacterium]|nr:bifunctional oligoribonuclease/PAP phosphatase NrnA [Oscillospiraceae bacterium]
MRIDYDEAAKFLQEHDNYIILTHQNPDGDTIGGGFGLCYALRSIGKKANVLCSDEFSERYEFLTSGCPPMKFKHDTIVSVDVADKALLGSKLAHYGDYVRLCIDHHKSNTGYAEKTLLNPDAAAACEVIYELFVNMNIRLDVTAAECLYTGIATDTGCFKYSCTTGRTHIIAAELMDCGIKFARINRDMFDIKSKGRVELERYIISSMEYFLDDKCSLITITKAVTEETGATSSDFEGISNLTLQLQGTRVGVVIKERDDGKFRVSMRSASDVDVSDICTKFGGGGHKRAAGCLMEGSPEVIKRRLLSAIAPALGMNLWLIDN